MTLSPAACRTIADFLNDTNTVPEDYDIILTGDLGAVGSKLLIDDATRKRLLQKYRVIHNDIHSGNIIRREDGKFVLFCFCFSFFLRIPSIASAINSE